MTAFKTLPLVAALALLTLVGCSEGPPKWQTTKLEGGGSVELPGSAKTQKQTQNTEIGDTTIHLYTVERSRGKEAYIASVNEFPVAASQLDAKQALDGAMNGAVGSMNGKVLNSKSITVDGHPGVEFRFEGKSKGQKVLGKCRTVMKGNRLFQLMSLTQKDALAEAETKRFLESLKVN